MVFKIAIIGAGPAGCMLARLLTHNSHNDQKISVTIFESEANIDFRSQGGSLDLHEKTGQAALKAGALFDEFLKYARYDGEAMKIADKNLLCYVKQGGGSQSKKKSVTGRPEIDRPKLREIIFNSLPKDTVQWSKKLLRISRDQKPSNLTLHFADNTTSSNFSLIVGADGAWSKVRPFLTPDTPHYSGIAGHQANIPNAATTHPELNALVNRGSVFAFSDGKSIMAQQMGDGSLNVSTWAVHTDPISTTSPSPSSGAAVKTAARKTYADWNPLLLSLIEAADDTTFIPRNLYMLPVGNTFTHIKGITLIGDAAHVMTPFAGEGVNLAMQDALKLSEAILSTSSSSSSSSSAPSDLDLDSKVLAFERDMFHRARITQELTMKMMTAMYLTEGAPRNGIERYILTAVEGELGTVMTMLITPVVYVWFFVFKLIW